MNDWKQYIAGERGFRDIIPILCGYEYCLPTFDYGPTARDYYLIHYIVSGRGTLETADGVFSLSAGMYFVIRPDEITRYYADKADPWHYQWFAFRGLYAECVMNDIPRCGKMSGTVFGEMQTALDNDFVGWKQMREEYIITCLWRIFHDLGYDGETRISIAERAKKYIELMYMQDISVQKIADVLSVDRRYLSRLFHARYGVSVQEHLVDVRLSHAYRLLQTGHPVAETAFLCGYRDRSNFSKMFYKRYGIWPRSVAENR